MCTKIQNKSVYVIVNGVNEAKFGQNSKVGHEFRSRIGLPQDSSNLVFGVVGRLMKDKGHPILYEAFSKLITEYPSNVYLIVAYFEPYEQRNNNSKSDRVLILGYMSLSK